MERVTDEEYWFREFDKEKRDALAKSGDAMPDGGFPITNAGDLQNAVQAIGRAKNPDAAKAHIIARAKALGKTDMLPADWPGSTKEKSAAEPVKCAECDGTGEVDGKPCPECDGEGTMTAGEPSVESVHSPAPMGKKQGPSPQYLAHLYSQIKAKGGSMTQEEFLAMAQKSMSHAGGKAKAAAAQAKAQADPGEPDEDDKAMAEFGDLADMCAKDHGWRLFVEHAFADPPDWMPLLPKAGKYEHPRYGTLDNSKTRNQRFIKNFKDGVYQSKLPINAEHARSTDGAYGWITDMRMNEDGSVDAKVDWTDLGTDAIKKDRFKYVSPEWVDSYTSPTKKTYKDVATGAALTVRPFFKEDVLRPLVATERGWFVSEGKPGRVPDPPRGTDSYLSISMFFEQLIPATRQDNPTTEEPRMAEDPKKAAEPEGDAKQFAEQIRTLTEENTGLKTANEALGKRVTAMEEAARRQKFADIVTGKAEGETRWFGETEKHIGMLMKLSTAFGEDSDEVKQYIEQNRSAAATMEKSEIFKEIGRDGSAVPDTSPDGALEALAKTFNEKEPGLTYEQAYAKALESPEGQKIYAARR